MGAKSLDTSTVTAISKQSYSPILSSCAVSRMIVSLSQTSRASLAFGATAYFTDTSGNAIPSGSGVVEASITAQGAFEVTFNPNQPEPSLFFEFCITSVQYETFPGSTATVSATLGPWTLNEPCDLAHAVPYVAGTPFVFQADEYVSAENGTEVGLLSMPMWFDSSGQQVFGSLTIQPVADIPEPTQTLSSIATIAAMALLRLRSPIRR